MDKLQLLSINVVSGSLRPFFQLDHQTNIRLYLTGATALCQSRILTSLTPS
jgi:hypothetical protein